MAAYYTSSGWLLQMCALVGDKQCSIGASSCSPSHCDGLEGFVDTLHQERLESRQVEATPVS